MALENWDKIKEIYFAADDIAQGEERERYLEEVCAGDEELLGEVKRLLGHEQKAENLMSRPLMDASGVHLFAEMIDSADPLIGRQIGAYRLEKEIGRGGMGAVYLAARADGSFRQSVAVKLIKRGMDTDFILRRFRQERQILASLNHPNIARLLDGGTTDEDLPYFVMEFIEGKPLYKYADEEKLSINERLKLFRQICKTLDFAHRNEVIHRDIKPPNILILKDGTPKLLDFGIAKVLNPEIGISTIDPTATAMRLMTPEYASPEQVSGLPVTPASDIYSLGVLLYELLTGHRPYRFGNRTPFEIARVICEEEPDRPSTGITREDNLLPTAASDAATLADVYSFRGAANVEDLQKELAGDVERVILKCLRKDATERYQTAAELADDIDRYLDGKPVLAETRFSSSAPLVPDKKAVAKIVAVRTAGTNADGEKSIAVLPLKLFGTPTGSDDEYLGIGLADALITRLSNVRRLTVRPTSSVLPFGDARTNPFEAGKELGVNYVLDGNIRRVGERIRVTVQLLSVNENSTNWAESFNERFTDVLELEDSISERVVKSLIPKLTGEEQQKLQKRGTNSPEAFEAYMRGRFRWNQFTPDSLEKAREAFQAAIELDPNYALPHVGLADFYIWSNIYGMIPSNEAVALAQASANRAIELDSQLGEAYASLGLTYQNRFSWARAYKIYAQALKLAPNYVHAHEWYAASLVGHGNFEKGVEEIKIAERLDPLSLRTKTLTAWTLYQAHRYDEALERGRQIIELEANYPQGYSQIGIALLAQGKAQEALPHLEKFDQMIPDSALAKFQLCFALVAVGQQAEARKILEDIKTLAANAYVKPFFLAMAHAALEMRDEAFANFERAARESEPWMLWFGTEPMLAHLRDDERYEDILRLMNNPLAKPKKDESKQSAASDEKSIAVLPLTLLGATLSGSADDEFLCVGLADALITRLSNVRRLVVRPTASILPYDKKSSDAFAAGGELGVNFVVDGTIRRVGERIRVSAQMLDVRNHSTVWARAFDEEFSDVLALEDSISNKIATSLLPQLTGEEEKRLGKHGTNSPEAFEAYMRGRYFATQFSKDALEKSLEAYREAVRLDPEYALPRVGIAEFYVWTSIMGAIRTGDAYPKAKEELHLALAADDSLAEAFALAAFVALLYDWNWTEAERLAKRAVELNPNYYAAHDAYAHILASRGDFDRAVAEIKRAEELDPRSPRAKIMVSCIAYQARKFDLSAAKADEALKMEANSPQAFMHLGNALTHGASDVRGVEALAASVNLWEKTAVNKFMLCFALVAQNRRGEAETILQEILNLAETEYVKSYFIAMAHVALGEIDAAFEWFEKSIEERDDWLLWFGTDTKLDALRNDARYVETLKKTNNPIIARQMPKVI